MSGPNDLDNIDVDSLNEGSLKASVGKYGPTHIPCYNTTTDQAIVRALLNTIPVRFGGRYDPSRPELLLKGDLKWGHVRNDLWAAIVEFQKNEYNQAEGLILDGHVDPHEKAYKRMLALRNWKPPVPSGDNQPARVPTPAVQYDIPPPPYDVDPYTVFAGNKFKVKALSMTTMEFMGAAGASARFKMWDTENNRAAVYIYTLAKGSTVGPPFPPISGSVSWAEGGWSETFTTGDNWLGVNQFHKCDVSIESEGTGGVGKYSLSHMKLAFELPKGGYVRVMVPTPNGFSLPGADHVRGKFFLVDGSLEVFKGP